MAEHEPPPATAGLQLDHAEFEHPAPAAITCAQCQRAIADQYYEAGGRTVCDRCRRLIEAELSAGSPLGRFVRAAALGTVAGTAGSVLWYALTQRNKGSVWGFMAIAVGYLVGAAVRKGAGRRGGWLYQLLALALTYLSIVATYVPEILQALNQNPDSATLPGPLRLILAISWALVVPFLGGFQNIIGLLIIGFGMYQAWAMNKRVQMTFNGPFRVGVATLPPPASA